MAAIGKTGTVSVDDYIASQPVAVQRALNTVRKVIRDALPQAEETISYNMPAYKFRGRILLYFAGWTSHYSIYPASQKVTIALKKALASCEVSKGTIRFSLSEPVPLNLIRRIVKLRVQEANERDKAKRAGKE